MFNWLKYSDEIIIRSYKVDIPVEIFRYILFVICLSGIFIESQLYLCSVVIILIVGNPVRLIKATETGIRIYTRIFIFKRDVVEVNSDLPEMAIEMGEDRYYYIILKDAHRKFILDKYPTLDKSQERFKKIASKIMRARPLKVVR